MHRSSTFLALTLASAMACEPSPADDSATPGDDRAGYFWCAEDALAPGITCPPDSLCCLTDGPSCATHEQGCADPFNVATCDGPEDCVGSGERCETQSHDRTCTSSEGIYTWCHTDQDCVDLFEGLPAGSCSPRGVCELPSTTPFARPL